MFRICMMICMTMRPDVMTNTVYIVQMREDYIIFIVIDKVFQASSLPVVIDFPCWQHQQFTEVWVFTAQTASPGPVANIINDFLM